MLSLLALVEQFGSTVQVLMAQRADEHIGEEVAFADLVAHDAYSSFMHSLCPTSSADEPAKASTQLTGAREPPLVCFGAEPSPLTVPRRMGGDDQSRRLPSLPIHLIFLPFNHVGNVWLFTSILHEVGHDIDHDLGLRTGLAGHLREALPRQGINDSERVRLWVHWTSEMLADALGVLLGGRGFVSALSQQLQPLASQTPELSADAGPHPAPGLRIRLLACLLERLDEPELPGSYAPASGEGVSEADFLADCALVAAALLDAPLAGLGGHSLRVLRDPSDRTHLEELARWLRSTDDVGEARRVRLRLVPSAAQLVIEQATEGAELERVHQRALSLYRSSPRPPWTMTDERRLFIQREVAHMVLPVMASKDAGRKVPPVQLLVEHERVVFVGATNGQLTAQLERAFSERQDRKWQWLEVYFLSESSVGLLTSPQCSTDDLRAQLQQERASLLQWLPCCAEGWALLEYNAPLYFASYWDWDRRGGRIHVSHAIHGADLRTAPGLDYLWQLDEPSPAYRAHADGLTALRQMARPLASAGTPRP